MNNSYFTLESNYDTKISPSAFGYWSVRWAADVAENCLNNIKDERMLSFDMYMQYLSLTMSSYWAYAITVLNAPQSVVEDFEIGFNDSLNDLLEPNGSSLSERSKKYLYAYHKKYFSILMESSETNFDERSGPRWLDT